MKTSTFSDFVFVTDNFVWRALSDLKPQLLWVPVSISQTYKAACHNNQQIFI